MTKLSLRAAGLAAAVFFQVGFASAEEAFTPPIVEATITGVSSEALGDGRYRVTLNADVVNTSDAPLEGVELVVVDAGGMPVESSRATVSVGAMKVLEPIAVALEIQTFSAGQSFDDLQPVVAGSAIDTFGEPIGVWVETKEAAQ